MYISHKNFNKLIISTNHINKVNQYSIINFYIQQSISMMKLKWIFLQTESLTNIDLLILQKHLKFIITNKYIHE